ncbi:hypothetical protein O0I10_005542 [Lichtheimia ornata]|uniref:Cytochrome p450 n=1 Tax=Lichtheimia ornata TaxID=688661 RepID=A0AAD7V5V4_9FUNG|nr:uncharacterized protein O0I10_005542 [Lichtheimia ornata]KAJ8658815.1 hypothetical protein O0I10_005542 [Lichtheimia ornata]
MNQDTVFRQSLQVVAQRMIDVFGNRQNAIHQISKAALVSAITYYLALKMYDAFFGPLRNIPGPFKFKFMDVVYASKAPGKVWRYFKNLQKTYGQVVRVGPRHTLIADKDMLRQVLLKDDLPKGPLYDRLNSGNRDNAGTVFSTTDKTFHKKRRRVVSPAFSTKYINSLEHYMADILESFIKRIDNDIENTFDPHTGYGTVDIWILLQYLALDIIAETAFGGTFHLLDGSDHLVPQVVSQNMKLASHVASHPFLGRLSLLLSARRLIAANVQLQEFMKKLIVGRIESGEEGRRNDILQFLIDTQQNADESLTANAIAEETVLFLIAGSETTSNSTGFAIIQLIKNPHVFKKLRDEIDAVPMNEDQKYFTHAQIQKLPYLNAVINETLRMDSIAANGLQRRADRDMVLGGRLFIPKGTIVHCNVYDAHLNPNYWPEPEKFDPERWLEGSSTPPDMDAFFPFSIGSRNCIGKTFALQEMRLSIAHLVKMFDFHATKQELEDAQDRSSFITLGVHKNSFMVQIKRREL